METKAQSIPTETTKKKGKKDPVKLLPTFSRSTRAKKLPTRLGGSSV